MNSRLGVKSLKSAWFSTFCLGFEHPGTHNFLTNSESSSVNVFSLCLVAWWSIAVIFGVDVKWCFSSFVGGVFCSNCLWFCLVCLVVFFAWCCSIFIVTYRNKRIKKLLHFQPKAACAGWSDRQLPRHLPYSCPSGPGWRWGSHRSADANPLPPWIPRSSWVTWQWWLLSFRWFRESFL